MWSFGFYWRPPGAGSGPPWRLYLALAGGGPLSHLVGERAVSGRIIAITGHWVPPSPITLWRGLQCGGPSHWDCLSGRLVSDLLHTAGHLHRPEPSAARQRSCCSGGWRGGSNLPTARLPSLSGVRASVEFLALRLGAARAGASAALALMGPGEFVSGGVPSNFSQPFFAGGQGSLCVGEVKEAVHTVILPGNLGDQSVVDEVAARLRTGRGTPRICGFSAFYLG